MRRRCPDGTPGAFRQTVLGGFGETPPREVGDGVSGTRDPGHGHGEHVRGDAGSAGVTAGRGERRVLAVLRGGLIQAACPDRLHARIVGAETGGATMPPPPPPPTPPPHPPPPDRPRHAAPVPPTPPRRTSRGHAGYAPHPPHKHCARARAPCSGSRRS